MAASAKQLQDQIAIAQQLCDAMKCAGEDAVAGGEKMAGMSAALQEAADAAEKPKNSLEQVGDSASGLADKLDASKVAAVGAGVGLISGFKGALGMLGAVGKGITGIVGSLGKVGKTILATPFKLMSGLVGMAQSGGGGPSPIREEMEAIRGEFGSLASNEGKAVASSLGQVQDSMGDLAGTGLSVRQVYGAGQGGVAAAMKDIHELATALGPALSGMTDVIAKSGVELSMYRKGLGLTADQQASMLKQASMAGKDPVEEMNKFASMAINMGEQFGVNAKVVGKSMATMAADVANFGTLSAKELGKAAIFANKLGIEAKELQGVISKFDNFEDAAKGAGEMAQAFGMNVDAMELMKAENPAERLSMLQKAFKETGKSVEDMSRQELKMLASQSGLSEEAAKLAFSQKGMSMSYDDISKGGDKAEKKQLSQAEAMDKLADSIQKMTGGGGGGQAFKGFFDAFLSGFGDGIKKSAEFRKMMKNIRQSLKVVFKAGREVGKLFVEMFPGVKQLMGGIADLFDPKKFKALMGDVVGIFKDFFGDLSKDPVKATETFIEKIKGAFGKFFGGQGGAAKDVKEGGSKIMKALGGIFTGLLSVALKGLTSLIKNITEKIKNPPELKAGADGMVGGFGATLIKALKGLVPPLLKALFEMGKAIFVKFKPQIIKVGTALLVASLTKMFLVAALSAAKGAIMGKVGSIVAGAFGKMFGGVAKNPAALKGADQMGKGMQKSGGMGKGFGGFIKGFASIKITDIIKAALKLSIMAITFIPVIKIFAFAAVEAYKVIKSSGPMKVAAGMLAMVVTITAVKFMADAGSKLNPGMVGKAAVGLVAGAVLLTVGAYAFGTALALAAPAFDGVDWMKVPGAMFGLAISALAAVGLMTAGAMLNPGAALAALGGLLVGSLMIGVGGLAFAIALGIANVAMGAVNLGEAAVNMGFMVLVAFAAIPLAVAAIALGIVAGPATGGIILGSIFVGVGALAMALALGITNKAMSKVDMPGATGNFLLLGIVTMAAIPVAVASIALGLVAIPGTIGATLGALFLGGGAAMLAIGLGVVAKEMDKVDMLKAAAGFLALAITVAASIPTAVASAALGIVAIPGLIGAALGAVFLSGGATLFAMALQTVAKEMDKVDMAKAAIGMGMLAIATIAAIPMAIAAVALGIVSIPGIIGLIPASAFMFAIAKMMGPALEAFGAMPIDPTAIAKNAMGLAAALGALALTALAAVLLIPFAVPFIGGWLMKKGISIIGKFMMMIADNLVGPLQAFAGMPIPADAQLGKKIDILNAAVDGVARLGEIGLGLAEIDTAAVEEGGKQGGTIKAVESFMNVLIGGMTGMILSIAAVAAVIPADKIGAVKAIAQVIEGLGKLIGGVVPPIADLAMEMMDASTEGGGLFSSGKVNTGKFDSMMSSVQGLLEGVFGVMQANITPMIKAILNVKIPQGEGTQQKIEMVAKVIDIMSKFLEPMQNVLKMMNEQEKKKSFFDKMIDVVSGTNPADSMMGKLKIIMTGLVEMIKQNLNVIVDTIISAAPKDPKAAEPKIKIVAAAIDIMGKMTSQLFKTLDLVKGSGKKPNLKSLEFLFGKKGNPQSSVMYMIADSAGEGIKAVVSKILEATKGLDAAAVEPTIKVVGMAIDSVSKFASAIIDTMKIAMPKGGDLKSTEAALPIVMKVMAGITAQMAKNLPEVINPIIAIASSIGASAGTAKGMEVVSSAIGAVGEFAGALKDVMSLVPDNPKGDIDPLKVFDVVTVVRELSGAIKDELPPLITSLMGSVLAVKKAKIRTSDVKKVVMLLEGVGHFASAMKDIMGLLPPPGKTNPKSMEERLKVIGQVAKATQEGMKELIGDANSGMTGLAMDVQKSKVTHSSINKLNKFFKGMVIFAEGLSALAGLKSAKEGVGEVIGGLAAAITDNKQALSDMIGTLGGFDAKALSKGAANMKRFGNMITKSVAPALTAIDDVSGVTADKVAQLDATMQKVSELISTTGSPEFNSVVELANVLTKPGKQTITVKTVAPNITANIQVNISAKQLAEAIKLTGEVVSSGDGTK